jgi:hypothetical protein
MRCSKSDGYHCARAEAISLSGSACLIMIEK